ncbi:MAG: hypothetical protein WA060_00650 [Minisyncoccia bacterium]
MKNKIYLAIFIVCGLLAAYLVFKTFISKEMFAFANMLFAIPIGAISLIFFFLFVYGKIYNNPEKFNKKNPIHATIKLSPNAIRGIALVLVFLFLIINNLSLPSGYIPFLSGLFLTIEMFSLPLAFILFIVSMFEKN